MTPEQRSLRSRMGAHALFATVDAVEHTAKAREGFLARFERQVDPDNSLPAAERRRRAEHARKAYMAGLAMKSAAARRRSA